MKHGDQKILASKVGISPAFMCQVLKGKKRPSWPTAKKLASVTGTSAVLWMEGRPEELCKALSQSTANGVAGRADIPSMA